MSDSETRPPIKAEIKTDPLERYSNGSLYPYWDLKEGGLAPYLNIVRRTFASLNPFSHQQVPTTDRMAVGIKFGPHYYRDQPYPNAAHFDHSYPSHYDPLADERFTPAHKTQHIVGELRTVYTNLAPRFCQRTVNIYKRCLLANDDQAQVCKQEQEDILALCPAWALNNFKERKLAVLKDEALSNKKYREITATADYNKGRTVADVPLRTWSDGNRHNLRPATLWADDRYADVTKEEIAAAKARVKSRRAANPQPKATIPVYDRTYEQPPRDIPLYSVEV